MSPVFPADILAAGQAEVSLMNQRRALQRVLAAFPLEVMMCQAPKFVVDEREERLPGQPLRVVGDHLYVCEQKTERVTDWQVPT